MSCQMVGRDPAEVTLIAVSKGRTIEDIRDAYELGIRNFGENRWQELKTKAPNLPVDINWHFIGHMQSNKAKEIASYAQVIHTIENERQLIQIDKAGQIVDGLIQVNIDEDPAKSGIFSQGLDKLIQDVLKYKLIRFRGLMTIGKIVNNPEESRVSFRSLKQEALRIGAEWVSMGMSSDYEVAIQEGATHIRIGSAIFGDKD